jgi:glycerol kinase
MLDESILGCAIPVAAMAGDQHASLFGQACLQPGMVKNTYGTGCFMLMNTGDKLIASKNGLLSTMAWRIGGQPTYALEGSVFMAGAIVKWLRDEMGLISSAAESEKAAYAVPDNGNVYLVPAFTGLGAPYWDMYGRGLIIGLTRGTGKNHIIRAALESIAYQTRDVLDAMARDSGLAPSLLRVDGGASANNFLMQFQSDILNVRLSRPEMVERTALGAAMLAGRTVGLWDDKALRTLASRTQEFTPRMSGDVRAELYRGWKRAVKRAMNWVEE